MSNRISVYLQYVVPQRLLTWFFGYAANTRIKWFKNWMIKRFIRKYHVDMSLAAIDNPEEFSDFNTFFIRHLKPELRPIATGADVVTCPVDGTVSEIGKINKNQLLQAKGSYFTLESLLGGDQQLAEAFYDGSFATLYLAPCDYHRIHMPLAGRLTKSIFVPGKLFSVNRMTADIIPNLFSRNERLITLFETEAGPMAVILVGAMIVGSIETVWMKNSFSRKYIQVSTPSKSIALAKGAELGHFKLGSTVIVLFGKDKVEWAKTATKQASVQFGQIIGNIIK